MNRAEALVSLPRKPETERHAVPAEKIFEADLSINSLVSGIPIIPTTGWKGANRAEETLDGADWADAKVLVRRYKRNFTIFEGTSEIQHLVIARAISGIHIN